MPDPIIERIEKEIKSHKVVLFVKGTPQAPQVGERLRRTAGDALGKINRDLVDAEKQLRNM